MTRKDGWIQNFKKKRRKSPKKTKRLFCTHQQLPIAATNRKLLREVPGDLPDQLPRNKNCKCRGGPVNCLDAKVESVQDVVSILPHEEIHQTWPKIHQEGRKPTVIHLGVHSKLRNRPSDSPFFFGILASMGAPLYFEIGGVHFAPRGILPRLHTSIPPHWRPFAIREACRRRPKL